MRLETTVTTSVPLPAAQERIRNYFVAAGYRQETSTEGMMRFRRGTPWGSFVSFTPAGWGVAAEINLHSADDQVEVVAIFDVNTTGQAVTGKERDFWAAELDGLATALDSSSPVDVPAVTTANSALWQNIYFTIAVVGSAWLAGTLSGRLGASGWQQFTAFIAGAVLAFLIAARVMRFTQRTSRPMNVAAIEKDLVNGTATDESLLDKQPPLRSGLGPSEAPEEHQQANIRH